MLGAGAAGLFCASEAARGGCRVLLLDHADRIGKKILISGGGRANFTNIHTTAANFHSANPHFAKSALARYTPANFLSLVERYKIPWHEKTLGQLFCDRSARDIVAMLEQECALAKVEILLGAAPREPDLWIHPRCAFLIESFRTYRRAEQRGEVLDVPADPQHPAEEAIDALRGAVRTAFPEGRGPRPQFRQVRGIGP